MRRSSLWAWAGIFVACSLFWGCATVPVNLDQANYLSDSESPPEAAKPGTAPRVYVTKPPGKVAERVVTEKELQQVSEKDPEMSRVVCLEILARLNGKAREYVAQDVKHKRRIKAPSDFRAFRNWTPLPHSLAARVGLPKFVLVVKDIPFIGWYENANLKGDAQIGIGKQQAWTKSGLYRVAQKDPWHISQSYTDAYGRPALMPLALRIYGRVWIHAGDVIGGYCSHGCINLPLNPAEELYDWADIGTPVLVTDSLKNLDKDLKKNPALNPKTKSAGDPPPEKAKKKL